jgi:hypothetical protein
MAWSNSKVFIHALDGLGGTRNMNITADTLKAALYNTTPTPDNTVTATLSGYNAATSQWVVANELTSSTDWPAGGRPLASITYTAASNVFTFDAADTASTTAGATITAAFGCLVYDDTAASPAKQGISYHYFGGSQSVTAGSFTIVWNASGLWTATAT